MHARTHTRLGCARQVRARWPSPTWSSRRSRSCPSSWASSSCLFSKVNLNPEPHTRSLGVSFPLPRACVCVVCVCALCVLCVCRRELMWMCVMATRVILVLPWPCLSQKAVCVCVCVCLPLRLSQKAGFACVRACLCVCVCLSLSLCVSLCLPCRSQKASACFLRTPCVHVSRDGALGFRV